MDGVADVKAVKPWILPVIVTSQFCCTSLWFASNGVMEDLLVAYDLQQAALGHLTSAVQFGFISGTLIFAFFTIADRFAPSRVFFVSACLASLFNLAIIWEQQNLSTLLVLRFLTGFFLAGIYPVGMKIAADYYQKGLGKSLGYLVGALVLGTAFPHLARDLSGEINWKSVIILTTTIAIAGGLMLWMLVPDGPFRRAGQKLDFTALFKVFKHRKFRAAAFGYFGHMWELYAFWTFIPLILWQYGDLHPESSFNISLTTFFVIAGGGLACVIGGYLSLKFGPKSVAATALLLSGSCCLVSPLIFQQGNSMVLTGFLVFWGLVVVADSPLFSTLVANNANPEYRGTALTIVNCIGFSITIIGIQTIGIMGNYLNEKLLYILLAIGPIFGLWGLLGSRVAVVK